MRRARHAQRGLTLLQTAALASMSGIALLGSNIIFSEAELNTLVAESRANQAAVTVGLEAYRIDWGLFPYDGFSHSPGSADHDYNYWYLPVEMTTPIAYISPEVMWDPFRVALLDPEEDLFWQFRQMRYTSIESTWGDDWDFLQWLGPGVSVYFDDVTTEWGGWRLVIVGPDGFVGPFGPPAGLPWPGVSAYPACPVPYDPTNGIMSLGDLVASELAPQGYLNIPPLE